MSKQSRVFVTVISRSEEHTSELQSQSNLVCRLLLEKKKTIINTHNNRQLSTSSTYSHTITCLTWTLRLVFIQLSCHHYILTNVSCSLCTTHWYKSF